MARRCELCGKEPASGHTVSHSNIKNPRRFLPNLHEVRLRVDGRERRVRICTRCLRTSRKAPARP
jgi:large subunit ribosomal protein L28